MSRPRSGGRTSAAPARGGPAQRGVYVQAPKSDIFVVLLGVALGAMVVGCLLMFLVLNRYGFSRKVASVQQSASASIASTDLSPRSTRVLS